MQVHFASVHRGKPLYRQTPKGDGIWRNIEFIRVDPQQSADWLVVYDSPPKYLTVRVPWDRRMLFLTEPPEIKLYPTAYLNQFGFVVSPMPLSNAYRGTQINQQSALPWHYGVKMDQKDRRLGALDWHTLASGPDCSKDHALSVICSNKRKTAQQRLRLEFIEHLKKRLGKSLHVYGRGFRDISDKADAIAPYRYHLVLENNVINHFWTEKLADSYLGGAFPFYSGCANIGTYFSSQAFSAIDIRNPQNATDVIEQAMHTNLYDKRRSDLTEARARLMEVHNLFAVCRDLLCRFEREKPGRPDIGDEVTIYAVPDYQFASAIGRARRQFARLFAPS